MAKVGLILGSGLKKFASDFNNAELIHSDENSFHKKKILKTKIEGVDSIIFSGRDHFYEGVPTSKLFENVEICIKNSVKLLIVSNAAGGLNKYFNISDLMLITSFIDSINAFSCSGKFTQTDTNRKVISLAIENKIPLRKGVYFAMKGPNFETTAEIKFLRKTGADAVGMSTVPEIRYAIANGIKTIAISCITNTLREDMKFVTAHSDVEKAGNAAYEKFSNLLKLIVKNYKVFIQ